MNRNGIPTDLDLRNAGSLSISSETRPPPTPPTPRREEDAEEKNENDEDEEEEEEDDEAVEVHEQGRTLAQSGQRVMRRSRRQVGQIPFRRRFEGCFGHFHTSSASV